VYASFAIPIDWGLSAINSNTFVPSPARQRALPSPDTTFCCQKTRRTMEEPLLVLTIIPTTKLPAVLLSLLTWGFQCTAVVTFCGSPWPQQLNNPPLSRFRWCLLVGGTGLMASVGVACQWIFFLLDTTYLAQSLGQKNKKNKARYST
jgi:hypothetical protein